MVEPILGSRGRCTLCGAWLGVEPHLITHLPDGEHIRCMASAARPFPYQPKLDLLRRAYLRLRWQGAPKPALSLLIVAGRALRALQEDWPTGWSPKRDTQVCQKVSEAEAVLGALKKARQRAAIPAGWRR